LAYFFIQKWFSTYLSLHSKELGEKSFRSTYRVNLFASPLKESTLSLCGIHEKERMFQKDLTLYGNSYYEKE
jgi:hypothetical protein